MLVAFLIFLALAPSFARAGEALSEPVATPLDSESAGQTGMSAVSAVFKIVCPEQHESGTGFLHKSGAVITANHVVSGCTKPLIILPDQSAIASSIIASDVDLDLVILKPERPILRKPLTISAHPNITIGAQVTTWGFPGGYLGAAPMLSVGYLSGVDRVKTRSGRIVVQYVVNAAFNLGNSGGPLIEVGTGEVIGIVDSKLAPLSDQAMSALNALHGQHAGFIYTYTKPDGSAGKASEGQVVSWVLDELRNQVQLVIGHAVMLADIRLFLQSHGIEP